VPEDEKKFDLPKPVPLSSDDAEESAKRVGAWLEAKWAEDPVCPYCGTDKWGIDPNPFTVARWDVEGRGVPMYFVSCLNCGQGVFFPAQKLDLLPDDFEPIEQGEAQSEEGDSE
jgi:hypothetical protein